MDGSIIMTLQIVERGKVNRWKVESYVAAIGNRTMIGQEREGESEDRAENES